MPEPFRAPALATAFLTLAFLGPAAMPGHGATERCVPHSQAAQDLEAFRASTVFYEQFDIGEKIVAAHERCVLPDLEAWLTHDDRETRGNVAYLFGRFGDPRGLIVIEDILNDHTDRPGTAPGIKVGGEPDLSPGARANIDRQIKQDRYFAAHLLGDLKDPRAVPLLVTLLHDADVSWIVPWSLSQIGDPRAVPSLIAVLSEKDADMRTLAMDALVRMHATQAIPQIRNLVGDQSKTHYGPLITVDQAAREALQALGNSPPPTT